MISPPDGGEGESCAPKAQRKRRRRIGDGNIGSSPLERLSPWLHTFIHPLCTGFVVPFRQCLLWRYAEQGTCHSQLHAFFPRSAHSRLQFPDSSLSSPPLPTTPSPSLHPPHPTLRVPHHGHCLLQVRDVAQLQRHQAVPELLIRCRCSTCPCAAAGALQGQVKARAAAAAGGMQGRLLTALGSSHGRRGGGWRRRKRWRKRRLFWLLLPIRV